MKIAGYQMQPIVGDVGANLAKIEAAAERAAAEGGRLLIAPELALTGYGAADQFPDLATPAHGPVTDRLSEVAARHGIAIVAGFAEETHDGTFNSAFFTDGKGQTAVYRKCNLYGPYERAWFRQEDRRQVLVTLDDVKIGFLICYDVEFPENVRRLAKGGADLVVVPTALPTGWSGQFIAEHMIQVRAFENQVFVAYINHCGSDELFAYAGLSRVAAPDGKLVAKAPADGETLIFADIDPSAYAQSRAENTYLADLV
ncbi:carbon-nitrogen hydrolase family protein [Rhizobium sp. NTR19]|uniref:Carbon-nitrogen hydrolase family protein n=1 Tax=Neorhizobium turbinariae TaxID=2937795 RepID=A0ABT0INT0_9HYPH|nr:carbon-nitrogen hydrolase family protein [Neorhizobium turbinariae]MCK8779484.1 carbon-nitrogen hydrolase family protein [Neorhizobium turbinariae]